MYGLSIHYLVTVASFLLLKNNAIIFVDCFDINLEQEINKCYVFSLALITDVSIR